MAVNVNSNIAKARPSSSWKILHKDEVDGFSELETRVQTLEEGGGGGGGDLGPINAKLEDHETRIKALEEGVTDITFIAYDLNSETSRPTDKVQGKYEDPTYLCKTLHKDTDVRLQFRVGYTVSNNQPILKWKLVGDSNYSSTRFSTGDRCDQILKLAEGSHVELLCGVYNSFSEIEDVKLTTTKTTDYVLPESVVHHDEMETYVGAEITTAIDGIDVPELPSNNTTADNLAQQLNDNINMFGIAMNDTVVAGWEIHTDVQEAPQDGKPYVRQNGGWVELPAVGKPEWEDVTNPYRGDYSPDVIGTDWEDLGDNTFKITTIGSGRFYSRRLYFIDSTNFDVTATYRVSYSVIDCRLGGSYAFDPSIATAVYHSSEGAEPEYVALLLSSVDNSHKNFSKSLSFSFSGYDSYTSNELTSKMPSISCYESTDTAIQSITIKIKCEKYIGE